MDQLLNAVHQQLGGRTLAQLSHALDAEERTTDAGITSGLVLLLAALARTATSSDGAQALHWALVMDHDGSVLDDPPPLDALIRRPEADKLLAFVLRGRQDVAAAALSHASGLPVNASNELLTYLAPLLLGALGRTQRELALDAHGVATVLSRELNRVEQDDAVTALLVDTTSAEKLDPDERRKYLSDLFPW